MTEHRTRLRVRYPETDRMGVVHHSHHLVWFEVGRTELMREMGMPYASLEARSIYMPVVEAGARYRAPVRYDEEVDVVTRVEEVTGVTVRFGYTLVLAAGGKVAATGFTLHAATDGRGSARRLPAEVREKLERLAPPEGPGR
jgi:acyl-CoA thioester hydrolase